MLSLGTRTDTSERLRDRREAFAAVALVWPIAVFIGSLAFLAWRECLSDRLRPDAASFAPTSLRGAVNSWFESMSGFTTTGATVIYAQHEPQLHTRKHT
jgi:Trk-type K+ transport system membrane component